MERKYELLITSGLILNYTSLMCAGVTALYLASTEGHVDIVRLLLSVSTKTINHQTNVNGKGPLLKASVRGELCALHSSTSAAKCPIRSLIRHF